ncbi:MAG: SpoIID/LytB domain-containing protein [Ignavibacteriales bacterium]|nr:MAG: SpoIID/LytB domain-containing protein [Ignavibacteriales bacterium]
MKLITIFSSLIVFVFLSGCSGSERFTKDEDNGITATEVRLLIDESLNEKKLNLSVDCSLLSEEKKIKIIPAGENLTFSISGNGLSLKINNDSYKAEYFQLAPVNSNSLLSFSGKSLRGRLKIMNNSNSIMLINSVDLESYLKGVIPREMPLGNGNENYEALKAFAICARTYTMQQMDSKKYFDLYIDVRDQVFGGVEVESPISNKAVDETKGLILTFEGKPAKVFYSSTCAGKTEDAKNIFDIEVPYLKTIEDGNEPYCKISHAFNWQEVYSPELFVERILNNTDQYLLDSQGYVLEDVKILSRFKSGRVNELSIVLTDTVNGEKKYITLIGNNIRWIIKRADGNSILRSILFDVELDENKNVIITGKGYGHGVGLCQYGAIGQSREGKSYNEILSHYFPGTRVERLKD